MYHLSQYLNGTALVRKITINLIGKIVLSVSIRIINTREQQQMFSYCSYLFVYHLPIFVKDAHGYTN